jgi:hypothetical protein
MQVRHIFTRISHNCDSLYRIESCSPMHYEPNCYLYPCEMDFSDKLYQIMGSASQRNQIEG